jgi:hypothetical protein
MGKFAMKSETTDVVSSDATTESCRKFTYSWLWVGIKGAIAYNANVINPR